MSSGVCARLRSRLAYVVKDPLINLSSFDWSPYWTTPSSMDDIHSVFQPPDIRYLRDHHPQTLASLISSISTHLVYLSKLSNVPIHKFPKIHLLNCIRLLTLFMPFLYEKSSSALLEDKIFGQLNIILNIIQVGIFMNKFLQQNLIFQLLVLMMKVIMVKVPMMKLHH